MIAYLDSSVLLRIVIGEPNPLREWEQITVGVTSALTRVETARTMDRNLLLQTTSEAALSQKRSDLADILTRLDYLAIDDQVLTEAARPLSMVVGALDAIHLASAVIYRAGQSFTERPILFATHDVRLARAARAMRFEVIGTPA